VSQTTDQQPILPEAPETTELTSMVQQEMLAILPFSARVQSGFGAFGGMIVMLVRALRRAFTRPFAVGEVAYQIEALGTRSLSIATLTAVFAGLVMTLQFAFFMARFGLQHTVGKVVVLTLFRELGPVLTALTVGARIGSGITAELGSMKVTEQIDAISALGADPIKKLVTPRLLACIVVMPALTCLADVFGLVAGAVVATTQYDIPFDQFFRGAVETCDVVDFTSGVAKSAVFGGIIAVVGCYKGFDVSNGTEGVGKSTTETVAITSVAVCLSDFFLTKLFLAL
jgi:phospholipid/cholesterol/gamma-HCH transport system permease protein